MSKTMPKPDAAAYGRARTGMGINLLISQVADTDFAILHHGCAKWMVHNGASHHSNPLLGLTSNGALRGIGVELRVHGVDQEEEAARAGNRILQTPADKPDGLRECYLIAPDGYVWVASRTLR